MVELRAKKIEGIANDIPLATVEGEQEGDLLILGWGGTYGELKMLSINYIEKERKFLSAI
jgi:2-oxoglutarate ferredoxin oxidoreductase subunit alpha